MNDNLNKSRRVDVIERIKYVYLSINTLKSFENDCINADFKIRIQLQTFWWSPTANKTRLGGSDKDGNPQVETDRETECVCNLLIANKEAFDKVNFFWWLI